MFKRIFLTIVFAFGAYTYADDAKSLNDAQIKKILLTLNEGEIESSQTAAQRTQNPEVKSLATMMLTDHKTNTKETKEITKQNKINTKDSELSKALKKEAFAANKELRSAPKESFDKAYVNTQVAMHQKALSTLNEQLIPNASNEAFKAHLERTRDAVQAHLDHAQALQSKM